MNPFVAISLDMNQLDMARLPDRTDDALTIWDTTDWAVVTDDGQALFSDASTESDVVCTLDGLQHASLDRLSVIGTIDDDWGLVFSPGNG